MMYDKKMCEAISKSVEGMTVESLERIQDGDDHYWVLHFVGGEEMSIRLMAETQ